MSRITEAGRVISKKNEGILVAALGQIQSVLGFKPSDDGTADGTESEEQAAPATEAVRIPMHPGQSHPLAEAYTFANIHEMVQAALRQSLPARAYCYIQDMFAESVVYSTYDRNENRVLFEAPYTVAEDGTVTLGTPVEVRQRTVYEPVDPTATATTTSEAAQVDEVDVEGDVISLREAAVAEDGSARVKIIAEGWGASGFYPRSVLARDIPTVFPVGTKMYLNHPSKVEEAAQPERRIEQIAATVASTPVWEENGPKGAGMYADIKVVEQARSVINELAPHIGPSIWCKGRSILGEAQGKKGKIITQLFADSPIRRSIDFVTEPGAGGAIVERLREAASGATSNADDLIQESISQPQEGTVVTNEEAQQLRDENTRLREALTEVQAANTAMATQVARLAEAQNVQEAQRIAAPIIRASHLPEATQARIMESASKNVPTREDGTLDAEKLAEAVKGMVDGEVTFAREAYGFNPGAVRGFGAAGVSPAAGAGTAATGGKTPEEALRESFMERGLTEEQAKIAARGRGF